MRCFSFWRSLFATESGRRPVAASHTTSSPRRLNLPADDVDVDAAAQAPYTPCGEAKGRETERQARGERARRERVVGSRVGEGSEAEREESENSGEVEVAGTWGEGAKGEGGGEPGGGRERGGEGGERE